MARIFGIMMAGCMLAASAAVAAEQGLTVTVSGIGTDGALAKVHATCIATLDGKSTKGENTRPAISWSSGPAGTKSYAVLVTDPDVPADMGAINTTTTIEADAPRQMIYHWAWFDIPAATRSLPAGPATIGNGHGANNDVGGSTNYDGPCPPWNDLRVHRYHFTVYALDTARLRFDETPYARDAAALIAKHALAKGEAVGTFTLHPKLRKGL